MRTPHPLREAKPNALSSLRLGLVALAALLCAGTAFAADPAPSLGTVLPLYAGLPFAAMLLSIALFPLLAPRFWHHHFGKVTAFWGLTLALPFVAVHRGEALFELFHVCVADYVPFLILLWSLYTISGGILVTGRLSGSPLANTALLVLGTLTASWVGTTGAAMLLIRPFLRANAWRTHRAYQVVFFIFLVGNVGGALTPLGDPPLFLGYLHGVPFFWTFAIAPHTAVVSAVLLSLFYGLDLYFHGREAGRAPCCDGARLRVEGAHNLLLLAGVVGAVLASGVIPLGEVSLGGVPRAGADLARDGVLVALGVVSLVTTKRDLRDRNEFSWAPIREVAILFAGIFVTMIPVLLLLKAGPHGSLAFVLAAVRTPAHYFWASGGLSSFLDNAPTYLVFLSTELGQFFPGVPEHQAVGLLCAGKPSYLEAISAGSVFMGANTYIGNAPNFMIRSIAEEAGVTMPSFFGYILKYSLPILLPSFLLVTWLFFF